MTKTILITLAALLGIAIGAVLVMAARKPDNFQIQRAATIKAPPEAIFAYLNDFRKWVAWSPWEKKDPNLKRSYAGAASGVGAAYSWEGDKNVGAGGMKITESSPPSKLALNLDFTRPFEAHNIVEFTLVPQAGSTHLTWSMRGPTPFMAKIIHVFMNMDRMVGRDFEAGLASLKAAAEGEATREARA
jgi:uncharacterized protein YndB with AHSA1/START domain